MVDHVDDTVLLSWARQRRLDAFEELVRRHYDAVYRIAFRMLGNAADAEDATQEAFERAWRSIAAFRGASAFPTWMYRIVINTCFTTQRRHGRVVPLDCIGEAADSPDERPDRQAEDLACRAALTEAIMALKPEQRAPLVLREFADCSYEQIAAMLGLTSHAVRGRLHRARLELTEAMQHWR